MTPKQHIQAIFPSAHLRFYTDGHYRYEIWIDEKGHNWCASCAHTAPSAWQKAVGIVDRFMLRRLES